MSEKKTINDSTIARIGGNITAGMLNREVVYYDNISCAAIAEQAVRIARAIAAEVERSSEELGKARE